jgi:hypothetical protein
MAEGRLLRVVDFAKEFRSKLQQPGWRVGAWTWLAFAVLVLAIFFGIGSQWPGGPQWFMLPVILVAGVIPALLVGVFSTTLRRATGGVRGWVWWLSMLWVVAGAGGVAYAFVCTTLGCTTSQCTNYEFLDVLWNGEPVVVIIVGNLAQAAWPLLTVLVLVAGFVRLRGWRRRNWSRSAGWVGAWVASIALMVLVTVVAGLGSEHPSVGWFVMEQPLLAAWLALGVRVSRVLSTPAHSRHVPESRDRSSRQASS